MASSAIVSPLSLSHRGGVGSVQYSVFAEPLYVDPFSSIHRGIRWSSRRLQVRRRQQERKQVAVARQKQQRGLPSPPLISAQVDSVRGENNTEVDEEVSASFHSPSSSSDPGDALERRGSAKSTSTSASDLLSPASSESIDSTGGDTTTATFSTPIFVKYSKPGHAWPVLPASAASFLRHPTAPGLPDPAPTSAKGSMWPHTDVRQTDRLQREKAVCARISSLRPVELVPESALSAEQFTSSTDSLLSSASAMALVWRDHGGQPLTEQWLLPGQSAARSPPVHEPHPAQAPISTGADTVEGENHSEPSQPRADRPQVAASSSASPLKLLDLLRFAVALTERMEEVHSAGVVYNFLQPAMVLYSHIGQDGHVQLLDFTYAAYAANSPGTARSVPPVFPPSPPHFLPYVAPERFDLPESPSCSLDPRSDLYSVGVLLYELCTGSPPFVCSNFRRVRHLHRAKLPHRPTFPKEWTQSQHVGSDSCVSYLGDVILKLLAKSVEQRYQSSAGLLYDLRHLVRLVSPAEVPQAHSRSSPTLFSVGAMDRASTFRVSDVLQGRDEQLQQLTAMISDTVPLPTLVSPACPPSRRSRLALVQGQVGSGKSALLVELHRRLQQRDEEQRLPVLPIAVIRFRIDSTSDSADRAAQSPCLVLLLKSLQSLIIQALTVEEDVGHSRALLSKAVSGRESLCLTVLPALKPFLDRLTTEQPTPVVSSSATSHAPAPTTFPVDSPPLESGFSLSEVSSLVTALLSAFCGPSSCLVLLVDDVDACDAVCKEFLQSLLQTEAQTSTTKLPHCAVVATHTVPASPSSSPSPLPLSCANTLQLSLPPLTLSALSRQLTDSLSSASSKSSLVPAEVEELALLLLLKVSGVPLNVQRALHSLYTARLLQFDYARGEWRWQVEAIKFFDLGAPAPELLNARIAALSVEQCRALRVASCVGMEFSVAAVAFCLSLSYHRLVSLLAPGVQVGLVLPREKGLLLAAPAAADGNGAKEAEDVWLRFAHVRIRDRLYETSSLAFRQHVHLTYARSFLQPADEDGSGDQLQSRVEEHVLDIAHHYALSVDLLLPQPPPQQNSAPLKQTLSKTWDAEAAMQKAQELKQSVTFALAASRAAGRLKNPTAALQHARFAYSACQNLVTFSQLCHAQRSRAGSFVLGGFSFPSLWASDYDLCLAVFRQLASLLYASGDVEEADSVVSIALLHTTTTLDHVRLHDLRLDAALIRGDCSAAIQTGLQVLELLGLRLHPFDAREMAEWVYPPTVSVLLADFERGGAVKTASAPRQSHSSQSFLGHTDATVQASLYISRLLMPSWLEGRYFHDVLATSAELLHRHGLTLYHPHAIAFYSAALLAQRSPLVEDADELCRSTLTYFHNSLEQYATDRPAARLEQLLVSSVFLFFVSAWKMPLTESLDQFEEVRAGLLVLMPENTSKSRIALSHVDFHYCERLHWSGAPIRRVLAAQQEALSAVRGRAVLLYKDFYHVAALLLTTLQKGAAARPSETETDSEEVHGAAAVAANSGPIPVGPSSSLLDVSLAVEQRMTRMIAAASLPPVLSSVGRVWLLQWYFLTSNHAAALRLWSHLRASPQSTAVTLITHQQMLFYAALSTAATATDSIHDTTADGADGSAMLGFSETSAAELVGSVQSLLLDAKVVEDAAHNFDHKWALVEAELLKLRTMTREANRAHSYLPALVLYDSAIAGARRCGCAPDEAIACELVGRFTLMHSRYVEAVHYLQQAVDTYRQWGCTVKIHALLMEFGDLIATWSPTAGGARTYALLDRPSLLAQPIYAAPTQTAAAAVPHIAPQRVTGSAGPGLWDEDSLIRMTQTFSVETNVAVLLRKLLRVVLREAGASRCRLLMCRESRWTPHLTAVVEQTRPTPVDGTAKAAVVGDGVDGVEEDIRFIAHGDSPGSADYVDVSQVFPSSLLRYSLSTLSSLSLGPADIAQGPFSIDPYFAKRPLGACAVIPVVRHAQVAAMLYLEDDHGTAPVFAETMAALHFVCSQAALSLENASYTAALLSKNQLLEEEVRLRVEAVEAMKQAKEAAERADQVKSEFLSNMRSRRSATLHPTCKNVVCYLRASAHLSSSLSLSPSPVVAATRYAPH